MEHLKLTNHLMFALVMRNKEIAKTFAECVLGKKITSITVPESEKVIIPSIHQKSIRYDVYFEGEEGERYVLEMQKKDTKGIEARASYYQSILKNKTLKKGEDYRKISHTYVIFVCEFDLFKANLPVYNFEYMAHNRITNKYISLGDKSHIVIVNLEWNYEGIKLDNELYSIIKYLKEEEVTSEFTKMIDKEVERENKGDGIMHMLTEEQALNIQLNDAYDSGIEKGYEKGVKKMKEALQEALRMIKTTELSDEEIASITELDIEVIKNLEH